MTELKSVTLKTIITAVDILMSPWLTIQAIVFCACTTLNFYWHLAEVGTNVHFDVKLCKCCLFSNALMLHSGIDDESF